MSSDRVMLAALVSLAACTPFGEAPSAEPSPDGAPPAGPIGSGRGEGQTSLTSATINGYTAVSVGARANTSVLRVETPSIAAVGGVVLVWQVTATDAGRQTPQALAGAAGRYDLFRVAAVRGSDVELDRPLTFDVGDVGAQMVSVPEYGDVTVGAQIRVTPAAWDGRTGGIVALLASGTVRIDGQIDASGRGFRGGPADMNASGFGCTSGDGLPNDGYAPKGEGIARDHFAPAQAPRPATNGPFAYGNGGGGGGCHNAGGAGGGHGGAGGRGGDAFGMPPARAADPGARITYDPRERFVLGGGGGAGERNDSPGMLGGGAGGGIVLVRAKTIVGAGAVVARGDDGSRNTRDSGTGGGAGGLVVADASELLGCFAIDASGGNGGDGDNAGGPGGGGGPGRIALGGSTREPCTLVKGEPGRAGTESGTKRGAADGETQNPIVALTP